MAPPTNIRTHGQKGRKSQALPDNSISFLTVPNESVFYGPYLNPMAVVGGDSFPVEREAVPNEKV